MRFFRNSIQWLCGALLVLSMAGAAAAQNIATLKEQAKNGDAKAQYSLGAAYAVGREVPQDYTQAATWFRKAAEHGSAKAQNNLGVMYDVGRGVPQDSTQATKWYRKAAEQGVASSQAMLGLSYILGQGVPQDYSKAYFWLDLALGGKPDPYFPKLEDPFALFGGSSLSPGSSDFSEITSKLRVDAASHLTPANLSRVQERARKWLESHPQQP